MTGRLERVISGDLKRLMIFLPPRHGKSVLTSRLFSAYHLYRRPDQFVALVSYGAALAQSHARQCRDHVRESGVELRGDSQAVGHFETTAGGGCWSVGVGGALTGKGAHLVVLDDPVKNAEEAASEAIRAKTLEWYRSTLYSRLEPDAAAILIMTRWHEEDLAGALLSDQDEDDAEPWEVVSLPAVAEEADPLGRRPGEALCPDRYPIDKLDKIKRRIGSYYFASLYQQRPSPREGSFFQRSWFPISDASPAEALRVRYWDKAATAAAGDFTVGLRLARSAAGLFTVEDVVRGQWSPGERDAVIRQTAALDGIDTAIWLEQEPGSGGKESAMSSIRLLAGYTVRTETVTGDKSVRAGPFAAQAEAGNVRLLKGSWNHAFLEELCGFPTGQHDDIVDACSGAFNKLAAGLVLEFS